MLTERRVDAGIGGNYNNAPMLYDDQYPGYSGEHRNSPPASSTCASSSSPS